MRERDKQTFAGFWIARLPLPPPRLALREKSFFYNLMRFTTKRIFYEPYNNASNRSTGLPDGRTLWQKIWQKCEMGLFWDMMMGSMVRCIHSPTLELGLPLVAPK